MSTYSNRLQRAPQNLLQCVVRFFHPRSSCTTTHISADVQRITLNASCMTISGERTEQLDIFCHVTGFMSDFLSFTDVELIQFFHGAFQSVHEKVQWCTSMTQHVQTTRWLLVTVAAVSSLARCFTSITLPVGLLAPALVSPIVVSTPILTLPVV